MTFVTQKLRTIRFFDLANTQSLANPRLQRIALAFIVLFPELPIFVWYLATHV